MHFRNIPIIFRKMLNIRPAQILLKFFLGLPKCSSIPKDRNNCKAFYNRSITKFLSTYYFVIYSKHQDKILFSLSISLKCLSKGNNGVLKFGWNITINFQNSLKRILFYLMCEAFPIKGSHALPIMLQRPVFHRSQLGHRRIGQNTVIFSQVDPNCIPTERKTTLIKTASQEIFKTCPRPVISRVQCPLSPSSGINPEHSFSTARPICASFYDGEIAK